MEAKHETLEVPWQSPDAASIHWQSHTNSLFIYSDTCILSTVGYEDASYGGAKNV